MLLNCGVGEDSWESPGLQGDPTSSSSRKSVLNIHWKDWCWSWNSNTLATWCKELTHVKRPWCWERLKAGGEGDDRRWDGWMASLTQCTWVWVNSGSWWWTGRPGVLQSMGSQSWMWLSNWTEFNQFDFSTDHLVMSMCKVSCVAGRGYLLWPLCFLGKSLLAYALLHFVLPRSNQSQIYLDVRYLLTSYFCIPVPRHQKKSFFDVNSKRSYRSA